MVTAATVARHMPSVEDYRERLAVLQGSWDTLSLLSHLSGNATHMGGTRQAFEALTQELVRSLATETQRKALLALRARSQIAIDIIVRNLYERAADIGFLSSDEEIRRYLREQRQAAATADDARDRALRKSQDRLRQRFREYVAKYSVYQDVILLSPDGEVLLRLDQRAAPARSHDGLIAQALSTHAAYVETYRKFDLLPDQERSLVYSFRVCDGGKPLGILCLCFRFEDEMAEIFAKLRDPDDWSVFALLDAQGRVIASSDPWQLPAGAPLTLACEEGGRLVRFGGREYLAISRRTQGYQGYMGPGWYGHAMVAVEHAFERTGTQTAALLSERILADLRDSGTIFSAELRDIPAQAEHIQRELNRAVWNGNIRLATHAGSNTNFSKVLLWEIGNTGRRTQATFERSITDLQHTVVSAILDDAQLLASLAVDVLDRNLYERANDCRWWALNPMLIEHLSSGAQGGEAVAGVLRHINSLYTVYHDIVLFDAQRRIVAVSNQDNRRHIDTVIAESWSHETLLLRSSQDFVASKHAPSAFYGEQPTLVFSAAIRGTAGRTVGGIGVVFDAAPQLRSILRDALPRTETGEPVAGGISVLVDSALRVVAASSVYQFGDTLPLPKDVLSDPHRASARVIALDGRYYAVGARRTGGYREYKATSLWCLVMIPLGAVAQHQGAAAHTGAQTPAAHERMSAQELRTNEAQLDIATVHCSGQWLGLAREQVVEAIDGGQLRTIPDSPPWHAGLLMYGDGPIPVLDLARLMDNSAATQGRDVVVVRPEAGAPAIGLLVDELGGVPAIPASRILPMTNVSQRGGAAIVTRAVRPEQPDDPMLLLVDLQPLLAHTTGRQPALS
jgi:chemotaxis signal transduction protein